MLQLRKGIQPDIRKLLKKMGGKVRINHHELWGGGGASPGVRPLYQSNGNYCLKIDGM